MTDNFQNCLWYYSSIWRVNSDGY